MEQPPTLPGVGRKTANLVLILAHSSQGEHLRGHPRSPDRFNRLGCGHPHAGGNRACAYAVAERRWWPIINLYLVTWGQNVPLLVYPLCGSCKIADLCPRYWRHEKWGRPRELRRKTKGRNVRLGVGCRAPAEGRRERGEAEREQ